MEYTGTRGCLDKQNVWIHTKLNQLLKLLARNKKKHKDIENSYEDELW